MTQDLSYIIITPAYNEQANIAQTIQSVITQTIKPLCWVIVDDGSTDKTSAIIKKYKADYNWIKYIYRSKIASQSYYASNVLAIAEGLKAVQSLQYKYLAILDADITLPNDYYQNIFNRMTAGDKIGIASGVYKDNLGNGNFRKILNDRRSTPKGIMVFTKECFEDIGGFIPAKYGGEDTIACFTARMKGYKVWSYDDIEAIHNKPVGTGHSRQLLKVRFKQGIGDYFIATHPLFMLIKSIKRSIKEPPFIIAGLMRLLGFIAGYLKFEKRQISAELIAFIRAEQLRRVFSFNKIPDQYKVKD